MPLEVVYGESRNRLTAQTLVDTLRQVVHEGTIYLAYPVLATADEMVAIDALLVSEAHGLVAFVIEGPSPHGSDEWAEVADAQDRLYSTLDGYLRKYQSLRRGRDLAVKPVTMTLFSSPVSPPSGATGSGGIFAALEEVGQQVAQLKGIPADVMRDLEAALQRVSTMKPTNKRTKVTNNASRGAILREIGKEIANLDHFQKRAAVESPEGPQRIRGLAGSGKTVVLCLKAAYWHGLHPDWSIALTFSSRALYQQIEDLVTRFTFEQSNDKPNFAKLHIAHSWGSRSHVGIYSAIATELGEPIRDFAYARGKYGRDEAFRGICQELIDAATAHGAVTPIYDAVLVDEAQDLPPEFFRLLYIFTKPPKRIVWAYDEFQQLSEATMPTTDELFGVDESGQSLISLDSPPDAPRRDLVLPVCYRNTPWALVTAHAIGTGVYRDSPTLIQHPDDPRLWSDVGYQTTAGKLEFGQRVTLIRRPDSIPPHVGRLLTEADSVQLGYFNSEQQQDQWVAQQIQQNLTTDELDHEDILVVLPDTYRARPRGTRLMRELGRLQIACHLVGETASQDAIFIPESVAIAHIYRAKGNEAPMVYVLDTQYGDEGFNLRSRRNTIFTAITRSRAWVRVLGWGDKAQPLLQEAEAVRAHNYELTFRVPTAGELEEMRYRFRDRTREEEELARKGTEGFAAFMDAYRRGLVDFNQLPPDARTRLTQDLLREIEAEEDPFR